jgi:sulfur-oxidizing protein SoxZ
MSKEIKIRAKASDGIAKVKCLMSHIMETGTRRDSKSGELVPAHFIEEVTCEHNGKVVMTADWGPAVSKDPYLSFEFKGASKGDTIKISWRDNKGEEQSAEQKIK